MWIVIYIGYAIAFYYGVNLILNDRYKEDKEYTPVVFLIVSTLIEYEIYAFTI